MVALARRCTVCGHAQVQEIDRRLVRGETIAGIARDFAVSEDALKRHFENHTVKTLSASPTTAEMTQADDLLGQVRALQDEAQDILAEARAAGDLRTALRGIGQALSCLELLCKVEGRLQDQQSVQVNVNLDIYHSPEWREVGAMLAEVLAPYPDLRGEIAARLKAMAQAAEAGQ